METFQDPYGITREERGRGAMAAIVDENVRLIKTAASTCRRLGDTSCGRCRRAASWTTP